MWFFKPSFGTRAPGWKAVRATHLASHPYCEVCGYQWYLSVHHIQPYHLFPEKELDPSNLLTLGEYCPTGNHHLLFGHLGNWKSYNPTVVQDASFFLQKIRNRKT